MTLTHHLDIRNVWLTPRDIAMLGAELIRIYRGENQFLSPALARQFFAYEGEVDDSFRLGWDSLSSR